MRAIQQFSSDFAHAIQVGNRNHIFMRGDLKDAVARGVHDRLARSNMLFTKLFDNFRSGSRLVPDSSAADLPFELRDNFRWESVRINWEMPGLARRRPFPNGRWWCLSR